MSHYSLAPFQIFATIGEDIHSSSCPTNVSTTLVEKNINV
jgi:hypothetical protein